MDKHEIETAKLAIHTYCEWFTGRRLEHFQFGSLRWLEELSRYETLGEWWDNPVPNERILSDEAKVRKIENSTATAWRDIPTASLMPLIFTLRKPRGRATNTFIKNIFDSAEHAPASPRGPARIDFAELLLRPSLN